MLTFGIAVGAFFAYLIAYHTYGRWLSRRLFKLRRDAPVPSIELRDDKDFIPTRREVLFGHHFTSIAGTGPIVGPALAVIWGWLPALLWVLFGSIFIGAVHDLGALVISIRNRGQTIGQVAGRLINPRVKILFLIVLFLALTIVLAIFGLVIASIFDMYPASVLTIWLEIPLAIAAGYLIYRRGFKPHVPAVIALAVMLAAIVLAVYVPALQLKFQPVTVFGLAVSPVVIWTMLLFVYCYIASTLPVWVLLQPRDYINANKLVVSLLLLVGGIGAATFLTDGGTPMVAPAVQTHPAGAPPIMPFLFVVIACGAISGFHCLVSSGTSSKQIACEPDAHLVAYGSMLTEGFLAVLVILACTAGLGLGVHETIPAGYIGRGRTTNCPQFSMADGTTICIARPNATAKQPTMAEFWYRVSRGGKHTETGFRTIRSLSVGDVLAVRGGRVEVETNQHLLVRGIPAWTGRYGSWSAAGGLAAKVGAFVDGAGNFVSALGIPRPVAVAIMAVLVASFAATTLDTATRLQRYVIQELAATVAGMSPGGVANNSRPAGLPLLRPLFAPLTTKHGATMLAVGVAAVLAVVPPPGAAWQTGMGKGGLTLWPLFGAVNQLLAGLAFLVVAIYLVRRRLPRWFIIAPMALMLVVPFAAMVYQIFAGWGPLAILGGEGWMARGQWHLVITGLTICGLEIWMVAEALKLWPKIRGVLEPALPPTPRGFPVIPVTAGPSPQPSPWQGAGAGPSPRRYPWEGKGADGGRSC